MTSADEPATVSVTASPCFHAAPVGSPLVLGKGKSSVAVHAQALDALDIPIDSSTCKTTSKLSMPGLKRKRYPSSLYIMAVPSTLDSAGLDSVAMGMVWRRCSRWLSVHASQRRMNAMSSAGKYLNSSASRAGIIVNTLFCPAVPIVERSEYLYPNRSKSRAFESKQSFSVPKQAFVPLSFVRSIW